MSVSVPSNAGPLRPASGRFVAAVHSEQRDAAEILTAISRANSRRNPPTVPLFLQEEVVDPTVLETPLGVDSGAAFRELGSEMYHALRKAGLGRDDAVDVAGQTLCEIIAKKSEWPAHPADFRRWVFWRLYKRLLDFRAKEQSERRRRRVVEASRPAVAPSAVDVLSRTEALAMIDALRDSLVPPLNELLGLWKSGLSEEEIAALLGVPAAELPKYKRRLERELRALERAGKLDVAAILEALEDRP